MQTFLLLGSNAFVDSYSKSDFFGKIIFLSLLLLSLLSWTIVISKALHLRQVHKACRHFHDAFQKKRHHPLSMETVENESYHLPFIDIYRTLKTQTLELLKKNQLSGGEQAGLAPADIECVASYLQARICKITLALSDNVYLLATTVTLAPFLGLLGTVWGILCSFAQMGASKQASDLMLNGLATALGTTVLGLVVAIPALIGYTYLRNKLREIQTELESFTSYALATVEVHYRQVQV